MATSSLATGATPLLVTKSCFFAVSSTSSLLASRACTAWSSVKPKSIRRSTCDWLNVTCTSNCGSGALVSHRDCHPVSFAFHVSVPSAGVAGLSTCYVLRLSDGARQQRVLPHLLVLAADITTATGRFSVAGAARYHRPQQQYNRDHGSGESNGGGAGATAPLLHPSSTISTTEDRSSRIGTMAAVVGSPIARGWWLQLIIREILCSFIFEDADGRAATSIDLLYVTCRVL